MLTKLMAGTHALKCPMTNLLEMQVSCSFVFLVSRLLTLKLENFMFFALGVRMLKYQVSVPLECLGGVPLTKVRI
jgi:hypothetical protein